MITAVTGTPGAGKSFRGVHSIVKALRRGKYVITNVHLVDGWEHRLASTGLLTRLSSRTNWGRERIEKRAANYASRVYYARDLGELECVRIPCHRCGKRPGRLDQVEEYPELYCRHRPKEGRALAVIDEAYKWLNNRAYSREDRAGHVEWFKLHRKLGIDVELIEQHFDSIDKQVRDLVEFLIRLRNMRNVRIAGLRIIPFNLFMAIHVWNQGPAHKRHVAKRELYTLDWTRELYDTMGTFHGVDDLPEDRMIWLGQGAAGAGRVQLQAPV